MSKVAIGIGVVVATALAASAPAVAKDTLTAVTALQTNNTMSQSFLLQFAAPVNKAANGIKISYIGGQEVVPPNKAAGALQRGQFDMLHSPSSYYIGTVPEAQAVLAGNQGPSALRSNGGWKLLQEIWEKKAGAYLLAWGESMTSYNMYLAKKPPMKDGLPDLTGFKMRATGTYRPLFRALGATTVNIKSSEVINAVQRGTVDGFGFTDQPTSVGYQEIIKFRVLPNFYQTNTFITVNVAAWKALSQKQRDFLEAAGKEYETKSVLYSEDVRLADEAVLKKAGVQDIVLQGDAARRYVDIAHEEAWKEVAKRSDNAEKLRPYLYIPGKPTWQVDAATLKARHRQ